MKSEITRHFASALILMAVLAPVAYAQQPFEANWAKRSDFVSDASYVFATSISSAVDRTPEGMANAANAFLDSLDQTLRDRAALSLDDRERREWTNLPPQPGAGGIRLGELDEEQLVAARTLVASLFSEPGFRKVCEIMLGDDQLLENGRPRPGFGTVEYSIMVFGRPTATDPWAFQLDGHHLGVNVAIEGDRVSLSPSFVGAQPEKFEIAGHEFRPFAGEVDDALALIAQLADDQRIEAVTSAVPGEIQLGPGADGQSLEPRGARCRSFNDAQRKQLLKLIDNWVEFLPPANAAERMSKLTGEIDEMYFAWNGEIDPQNDMSYTVQGPSLIIEFSCQGRGPRPYDHLHSMYRDPTDEYGGQLKRP
jgi:hypothetical protein